MRDIDSKPVNPSGNIIMPVEIIDIDPRLQQRFAMEGLRIIATPKSQAVAAWRQKKTSEGMQTFRVQLPKSLANAIKEEQQVRKLRGLGQYLDDLINTARGVVDIENLTMPPMTPRTEPLHDATIMLAGDNVRFLNRIKDTIGLPRAKAIHALMLTVPDAIARAEANRQQARFNFTEEVAPKSK